MIRNNILNFSKNLREAAKYIIELRSSSIENPLKRDLESLLLSKRDRFYKLNFYNLNLINPISATDFCFNIKNFSFFIYYNYKNNLSVEEAIVNFSRRNEIYFKQLNRQLKKINDQIDETSIVLNSKYTKAYVNSYFQEKDFQEQYDLEDIKTERTLRKKEVLEFKTDTLNLPVYFKQKVVIQKADIDWNKSFFGKETVPVKISKNTSDSFREENVFHWIVKQNEFSKTGQKINSKNINLSLIFSLVGIQKLNNIYIEFASELPILLVNNTFEYWDSDQLLWREAGGLSTVNQSNRLQIFLQDEIETKKIRLNFYQKKYYDNIKLNNKSIIEEEIQKIVNNSNIAYSELEEEKSTYKVFDLSLKDIKINYMKYKHFGFFRDGNPVGVNKPLSFWMDVELLHDDLDCYIEKYCHVVLFGEEDYAAIKKQHSLYENIARYNNVVAIPNGIYEEEELLVFKHKTAKCLFFPDIRVHGKGLEDRIKVYKDNVLLMLGTDYNISLDNLNSIVNPLNSIAEIESLNPNKVSGYFHIILKGVPTRTSKYSIKYDLDKSFDTDETGLIKINSGKLVFDKKLFGSVGFLRPRINMRSVSLMNDTSYIKKYKVYIEELDATESAYIEYEDFLEQNSRSTNNVI